MTPVTPAWSWAEGRQAGEGMRRLRKEQGLTQPELAARMGTSKGRVSLQERGAARMGREAAERAAWALGTDLAGLLEAGGGPGGNSLPWPDARRAAAVLKAAWEASGRRQQDVAAGLGWSPAKVSHALNAVIRMSAADALALAGVLGADLSELELADGETE